MKGIWSLLAAAAFVQQPSCEALGNMYRTLIRRS